MVNKVLDRLGHPLTETAGTKAPRTECQNEAVLQNAACEKAAQLLGHSLRYGTAFGFERWACAAAELSGTPRSGGRR